MDQGSFSLTRCSVLKPLRKTCFMTPAGEGPGPVYSTWHNRHRESQISTKATTVNLKSNFKVPAQPNQSYSYLTCAAWGLFSVREDKIPPLAVHRRQLMLHSLMLLCHLCRLFLSVWDSAAVQCYGYLATLKGSKLCSKADFKSWWKSRNSETQFIIPLATEVT